MKREIKFRAWDFQNLKWATNNDVKESIGLEFDCEAYFLREGNNHSSRWDFQQYTGLKSSDTGGLPIKEAYFGDFIRFFNTDGKEIHAELIWYEKEYCIGFKRLSDGFIYTQRMFNDSGYFQPSKIQFEIIGNIYETPELLN